jgi:AAHS family 3-hydroxyphenylpropionic acid transporter
VISSAIPCIIVSALCMFLVVRQISQERALASSNPALSAAGKA